MFLLSKSAQIDIMCIMSIDHIKDPTYKQNILYKSSKKADHASPRVECTKNLTQVFAIKASITATTRIVT